MLNQIDSSPRSELVHDLMAIITIFSSRLHGLRKYRNKIKVDSTKADSGSEIEATPVDGSLPMGVQQNN